MTPASGAADSYPFSSALTVDALSKAIPEASIRQVIAQEGVGEVRERRLTAVLTVWLVIALHLFPSVSVSGVFRKLARGLRLFWPDPEVPLPSDSALAYRRRQVGARPLVALFHQVCRPIATPQTRGAFLFGLRLLAIDGTSEDVPDTEANAKAFGRHTCARGASAFPQLQGVYLVECGTHCVVDCGFWPCHTSERVGGFRLLRSVQRGMLLMWERGFHDFDMLVATRQRGAHVRGRLPAHVKPVPLRSLPDGSTLAYLLPSDDARRRRGVRVLVRVITYSISDPALPGYGEEHRLITSRLNPRLAPAHELACCYHERWESELTIDESDTHQRLVNRTLRSLTPVGVIQELYGILLAHYAVRVLLHEAALSADVDPDRLSFVHALEIVRDAVPEFQQVAPAQRQALYERMLREIATNTVLAPIAGKYRRVYTYRACDTADPWKLYAPPAPAPANDLTAIEPGLGLWVDMTEAATLSVPGAELASLSLQLCPGWTLPSPTELGPLVASTLKYRRIFAHDLADGGDPWAVFDEAAPPWANEVQALETGRGYWLFSDQATNVTLIPPAPTATPSPSSTATPTITPTPTATPTATPTPTGEPPTAVIRDLEEGARVTGRTVISGAVTSGTLRDWRLEYRFAGEEAWAALATGTTPMTEAAESTPAVANLLARARVYVEGSDTPQRLKPRGFLGQPAYWRA